jgi:hypothetical protein
VRNRLNRILTGVLFVQGLAFIFGLRVAAGIVFLGWALERHWSTED